MKPASWSTTWNPSKNAIVSNLCGFCAVYCLKVDTMINVIGWKSHDHTKTIITNLAGLACLNVVHICM